MRCDIRCNIFQKGDQMDAILLAAGNSTRFGENKLLYEIDGKPMFRHMLDTLYPFYKEGVISRLLVVTQYEQIMRTIRKEYVGAILVENHYPESGISHSIQLGIDYLETISNKTSEACLFAVSDQPYFSMSAMRGLLKTWQKICTPPQKARILVCTGKERLGNPVIFSNHYYKELKQLSGDVGGKSLVMAHPEDVMRYPVSENELEDIDVKNLAVKE